MTSGAALCGTRCPHQAAPPSRASQRRPIRTRRTRRLDACTSRPGPLGRPPPRGAPRADDESTRFERDLPQLLAGSAAIPLAAQLRQQRDRRPLPQQQRIVVRAPHAAVIVGLALQPLPRLEATEVIVPTDAAKISETPVQEEDVSDR